MENRPPLRSRRVCRFCLTESEPLRYIYERDPSKPFQVPLTLQIMSCVGIEVYAADGMPQMICKMCRWNLDHSYKFKMQCKQADEALRADPSTGILPRPFPPIPTDPPDLSGKRTSEQKIQNEQSKKPRVDNGDRERRETRERERERDRDRDRERERERERERDRERGRDRQVEIQRDKSEQRSMKNDFYEEEQDGGSEGEQDTSDPKEDRKLEPGEIRVHACDQCERTFPLRQSLVLHIQRAHRDRHHKCTECDRMFFSKYDLSKHMTTHSEEKPYSCPICQKQFSRANLLQRHEKVHREELRYGCPHCEREFFTTEELEKHEEAAHKKDKPYQCNICNKCFSYKQGLERHEILHNEDKSFVCEYCKEAFRTSTKLARHLTSHAGHRPYLCKLCPRTFLLSHHLTRHMRTHSVEKRHVCEDCGKAFKRKESLEVHQLTHAKRTGLGLTCTVCQESCRNRADYVTHIKQHIEAGEKMGPDGLQPDKSKAEMDSEEEEEEEQYTDGDDDYEPPAYVIKKLPKNKPSESEDEGEKGEKEERKEQVVFVRGKDGNMIKKIKTLMPIQRREVQEAKTRISPSSSQPNAKPPQIKIDEPTKGRLDDTEAQVQKIVASVFKEHKIPLKHQSEQGKETSGGQSRSLVAQGQKDDKSSEESNASKPANTVKVIKRIVVRKSTGAADTSIGKEADITNASQTSSGSGIKVKRVIVRRIIRQGDTTREVIMNPDGTIIDPAELAKLPTGNVVKRVVMKKPLDKNQGIVQAVLHSSTVQGSSSMKNSDQILSETPKFELKTSQASATCSLGTKTTATITPKTAQLAKGDQETKEKLEQLEKRVEQQRLKIEELQARKQQEYEAIDEMLPERHDESEDEQQLPLKRVFVKRKQSIYDEEQEYHDNVLKPVVVTRDKDPDEERSSAKESHSPETSQKEMKKDVRQPILTSSKVYGNKKIIVVKAEEASDVEQMSRELSSILDSTDNVVKMQESVLSNLSEISNIDETAEKKYDETGEDKDVTIEAEHMDEDIIETGVDEPQQDAENAKAADGSTAESVMEPDMKMEPIEEQVVEQEENHDTSLELDGQDLSETADIFEPSDNVLDVQKSQGHLSDSAIQLDHDAGSINLNDTNDSQDSLEDKLSRMEG